MKCRNALRSNGPPQPATVAGGIQVYIIAALKKKREYANRHHSHRRHPNVYGPSLCPGPDMEVAATPGPAAVFDMGMTPNRP